MLKLPGIEPGALQPVQAWVSTPTGSQRVEVDPKQHFLTSCKEQPEQESTPIYDNLPPEAKAYHRNYLAYLTRCWNDRLGAVLTPDILWYTLLSELVLIIRESPETYRHLFSKSSTKEEIIVTAGGYVMPLATLVDLLADRVPTDTSTFLPKFTTTGPRAQHAMYAAFCDMCSPFYVYSMLLCGIPMIDIRGERQDYLEVVARWRQLTSHFSAVADYMARVDEVLINIVRGLADAKFWQGMFRLDHCGSGHQTVVRGWWSRLYRKQPELAYVGNFSPHVAKVSYKSLNYTPAKHLEMYDGLFFSRLDGDLLIPQFGYVVMESKPQAEVGTRP